MAEVARAYRALEQVMDPEFPISVVAMGLVRGIEIEEGIARVTLTYTSMGCPWTDWIEREVREKLLELDGITGVRIDVAWDKPWTRDDLAPAARIVLKKLGVSP